MNSVLDIISPNDNDTREIKICVRALRKEITDIIIKYKITHPNISFRTIFDLTGSQEQDFNIIIDDKPLQYPEYEKFEFCSKRIRLKAVTDSPLCNKELYLKQLCKQPFISFGENSSTHKMLLKACQREGFTPNFVVQTNDLLCYNRYVEAGIGIGVERYDKENETGDEKTQFLNVIDFRERQTVYVFYKLHSAYGNIQDFLDFLRDKSSW